MPCDTIQYNRVDLDRAKMQPQLLDAALRALGATVINLQAGSFSYAGQYFVMQGGELVSQSENVGTVADLVRRHYSAQVVKYSALRAGFQVKQTGAFSYQVIRS